MRRRQKGSVTLTWWRSAGQVRVMQALWAEPHVRFAGEFHRIDDAGINPRPRSGACRSGMAGTPKRLSGAVQNTAAAICRSPIPGARPHSPRSPNCGHCARGRARPVSDGARSLVLPGDGTPEDWRHEIELWRAAGVSNVTVHTTYVSGHHKRISGRSVADHLTAITRYREAVADLL
jgi:hypothetical protein